MAAGKLAENIMHFARVLRAAGLPIGPDRVADALRALQAAGIARRDDFYWTLAAVFLSKREQQEGFDQAELSHDEPSEQNQGYERCW